MESTQERNRSKQTGVENRAASRIQTKKAGTPLMEYPGVGER